jgi:hypothetical protein
VPWGSKKRHQEKATLQRQRELGLLITFHPLNNMQQKSLENGYCEIDMYFSG